MSKHCVNTVIYQFLSAQCKLFMDTSKHLKQVMVWQQVLLCLNVTGPIWRRARNGLVLLAARRYDGSRSRKTRGSLADTLQCNIWRRAQTPHTMTHVFHGGDNHGNFNGFTAFGKKIGTPKSSEMDSDYVKEHQVLKYFRKKLACYLHDFRRHWFNLLGLPVPNGKHDQLYESQV